MQTMYLLGAGASVDAGVPMAIPMTQRIDELLQNRGWKDALETYRYVVGGLLLQKAIEGHSPYDGLNVEEVYSALELLAQRDRLEASPFVSSWHPAVDRLDRRMYAYQYEQLARAIRHDVHSLLGGSIPKPSTSTFTSARFDARAAGRRLEDALRGWGGGTVRDMMTDIGQAVEVAISTYLEDWSSQLGRRIDVDPSGVTDAISGAIQTATAEGTGMAFQSTCESVLSLLSGLTWVSDGSRVEYLNPLLQPARSGPVTIATLNYDNCVEKACECLDLSVDTGLPAWNRSGAFSFDTGQVRLLKLHGSINWMTSQEHGPHGLVRESVWEVPVGEDGFSGHRPVLVFGQREKLRAGGPFIDLLAAFRLELRKTESLVVAGYSFRDAHINDCLERWLMVGNRRLTIVAPSVPEGEMARELLPRRGTGLVRHVQKGIAEALADGDLPVGE